MFLEDVGPSDSKPLRGLREAPNDEMSIIEGEMSLDSASYDVVKGFNPVAKAIGYK